MAQNDDAPKPVIPAPAARPAAPAKPAADAERDDPNAGRPTPTQAENDAIRTGDLHIDDKEHDGSVRREPGVPYVTRTAKAV